MFRDVRARRGDAMIDMADRQLNPEIGSNPPHEIQQGDGIGSTADSQQGTTGLWEQSRVSRVVEQAAG